MCGQGVPTAEQTAPQSGAVKRADDCFVPMGSRGFNGYLPACTAFATYDHSLQHDHVQQVAEPTQGTYGERISDDSNAKLQGGKLEGGRRDQGVGHRLVGEALGSQPARNH